MRRIVKILSDISFLKINAFLICVDYQKFTFFFRHFLHVYCAMQINNKLKYKYENVTRFSLSAQNAFQIIS